MPESIDEKTGKRIFHENENTLKIQENVEKKFNTKGSFMHRDFDDDQPYDAKRAVDGEGKPILVEKPVSIGTDYLKKFSSTCPKFVNVAFNRRYYNTVVKAIINNPLLF